MEKSDVRICCPHCRKAGAGVWLGYGRDWLLCSHCQRRVRWTELRAWQLIRDREEPKLRQATVSYH